MFRRRAGAVLVALIAACGGKTGLPEDRPPDEAIAKLPPCSDLHPCATAHCSLVVPSGAISPEARVEISERDQPSELATETTAPFVCEVTTSAAPTAPFALTMMPGARVTADTVIFSYAERHASAVRSSTPADDRVQALIPGTGLYGMTRGSAPWKVETTFERDPLASGTTSAFLRNLARSGTTAAYWDGVHFFMGSGPRVLIWNGVPDPGVKPSVVLGAPDLDSIPSGTSSSKLGSSVSAIWSDGTKLVVATGNRILIWNALPKESFATADIVLGQQDFASNGPNEGGISAATLAQPRGVDSDGERLLVADTLNHRVLVWSKFPSSIGEPAATVLGQPTFSSAEIGVFYQAWGALLDGPGAYVASFYTGPFRFAALSTNATPGISPVSGGGSLRVVPDALPLVSAVAKLPGATAFYDPYGQRIAFHDDGASAPLSFALGQPDLSRSVTSPVSASTVTDTRMTFSHGRLVIPDQNRVLLYDQPPTYNFEPATRAIGQAGFSVSDSSADYRSISARTLAYPADVSANGKTVAIADRGNNRVVLYDANVPPTNASASVVLGQPDDRSFVANGDQLEVSKGTLSGPAAVALDDRRVFVADTENHRILVWSSVPTQAGVAASIVLGQKDAAGRRPNHGNGDLDGDGFSDADAVGMFYPTGVATDGKHLFVSDRLNHRVLVWDDTSSLVDGQPADRVIGQSTFAATKANAGNGPFSPRIDGLNLPSGIALVGSSLWIADTENNRAIRWDDVMTAPVATAVIGQANGTTVANPNVLPLDSANSGVKVVPPPTADATLRPRSVAVLGDSVFVSEEATHRVHAFRGTGTSFVHSGQVGQRTATTAVPNENGIGASTLAAPSGIFVRGQELFVADAANHRVLSLAAALPEGVQADKVIGQPSFVSSGFNQSASATAGGAIRPRGLFIADGELFAVESSRHRVVVHELPLVSGKSPKRVLGQADANLGLPNAGGNPSAASMSAPQGVFVSPRHVLVADTGNNRVLVFARGGAEATLVLGQASFDGSLKNRGGEASASSLAAPAGVMVDGERLIVADTGNHRVLVWNAFPTANGQPADVVVGQDGFTSTLTNRGSAVASAQSLDLPSALLVDGGRIFVADSGNNRVLGFGLPLTNGASASFVLGQGDLDSRTASSDLNDTTRLSGPVALAADGTNLFVADRDSNRVVAYDLRVAATGVAARTLFNSNNGLIAVGPAGLAVERTPLFTSRLFVSDTNNGRILVLSPVSRLQ